MGKQEQPEMRKRPMEEGPASRQCAQAKVCEIGQVCADCLPLHTGVLRTWNWTHLPLRNDLPSASCSSCCAGWTSPRNSSPTWVGKAPSRVSPQRVSVEHQLWRTLLGMMGWISREQDKDRSASASLFWSQTVRITHN